MSSDELSRATRSRAVKGGKTTCSRCDASRAPGSAYCPTHRNAYQSDWRKANTIKLRELKEFKRKHALQNARDVQDSVAVRPSAPE